LREALGAAFQIRVLSSTATGGSGNTLEDTTQAWGVDQYAGDEVRFTIAGVNYRQVIISNTATELTFHTLPLGVSVSAGLAYEIWRYVGYLDITDRIARELGIIDNLRKWGGTALSGRDISLDLAKLDVALSTRASESVLTALRDKFSNVYTVSRGLDLTVAQSITLDPAGRTVIGVWASSTVATTFHLDVSEDGVTWIDDWVTYSAVTEVKEGYFSGWRYLRLRSDAAGAAGDTVSLGLVAGR